MRLYLTHLLHKISLVMELPCASNGPGKGLGVTYGLRKGVPFVHYSLVKGLSAAGSA